MAASRVLVIDGDDWVARLLVTGLRDHGFEVRACASGEQALSLAQSLEPACIVTELVLPGLNGTTLIRALRSTSPLAWRPILVLSSAQAWASRQSAFQAGADVFMAKPFRLEEVALQLRALVAMTERLRALGSTLGTTSPASSLSDSIVPEGHAFEGNLAQLSIATVLTLLEMERRSGMLKLSSADRKCALSLTQGQVVGGSLNGQECAPLEVVRELLRWQKGRFRFRSGPDLSASAEPQPVGALLLEAFRLEDEAEQASSSWLELEEAPTEPRFLSTDSTGLPRAADPSALAQSSDSAAGALPHAPRPTRPAIFPTKKD